MSRTICLTKNGLSAFLKWLIWLYLSNLQISFAIWESWHISENCTCEKHHCRNRNYSCVNVNWQQHFITFQKHLISVNFQILKKFWIHIQDEIGETLFKIVMQNQTIFYVIENFQKLKHFGFMKHVLYVVGDCTVWFFYVFLIMQYDF